ncbi:MAG: 5-dehydro-4-deoxyglucarate dehydratase [Marinomonas sp.]|jgi:5-dehydro-4-deoxyglucarate dehydratase|uniref:Probable 5-dehydro-4-deoxyglucarate dehydratase n=1 Tax=Marinomonas communis TaxID=28254 RepID=A0A4R6X520_9GAMM|nr:5-dehydro-4-deoxyglucarate dehydratase [Marinomonas communis]MAF15868.1 5-dehydro-4-deoxyglucarate dehydratase [Marinomonas sp.]MCC4273688.1 5-dehydro-4-deoxyglucarate dehydratase [Marinomonas communis]TDR14036.1 5-dehydro-4-deoxyglucarate dehydratase [Marinomonas communis]|tara:strand:- start:1834 stop:2745 length:912 start_codon:yes stop_codon:yes gene_type:complete
MAFSVEQIREALSDGLLSFPVTDFDANGKFNAETYKGRLEAFIEHGVSSIFIAGGTGEFFSLDEEDFREIVEVSVATVKGRVPVIAAAGRSVKDASKFSNIAAEAGCDGILLMPPFLTECPEDGIVEYATAVMQSADIQFVYYNRGNGILSAESVKELAARNPNMVGLKDGVGNIAALNDTIKTVGDRLVYIGGVPTAEIFAEAYLSIGVNTYSSAAYNFMPEMAMSFYKALRAGDKATVTRIIQNFFIPFCRLRDTKKGYAVSLIKAGVALQGMPAGDVRPPLTMPNDADLAALKAIIDQNK